MDKRPVTHRRRLGVAATATALLALTGCGGGDSTVSDPLTTPGGDGSPYARLDPTALKACLVAAGEPAEVDSSTPLGVTVPVSGVTIAPATGSTQGVDLWVFLDAADAATNRSKITLTDQDTPTSRIVQNVVVHYYAFPESGDTLVAAVEGCLAG